MHNKFVLGCVTNIGGLSRKVFSIWPHSQKNVQHQYPSTLFLFEKSKDNDLEQFLDEMTKLKMAS